MSPVRWAIPLWGMRYNFPQPSCPARVKLNEEDITGALG